ncbi:MAG: hypothetical protein RML15_06435 [Bacteroidota bacterium]|nr:hypothetical protein [Candidatus Kapabacteria bacterium]MCS7303256.1 hypothetical protein [Candidatus Kapabacteria bacterium]MCX7937645.1 hypothetical protein [Chlorobiota bacterium]MDW8075081.1 hypothetical protein [Bacteroidota bacterium]MDW8272030.1 hypothetical protein [Bacteroidota bacterium]
MDRWTAKIIAFLLSTILAVEATGSIELLSTVAPVAVIDQEDVDRERTPNSSTAGTTDDQVSKRTTGPVYWFSDFAYTATPQEWTFVASAQTVLAATCYRWIPLSFIPRWLYLLYCSFRC